MKENSPAIGIRHFEDINALSTEGLNAGLIEGQEDLSESTAKSLVSKAYEGGFDYIEIFASDQKRTSETALMLKNSIDEIKPGFNEVNIDHRLRDLDQGELNLGPNYVDGEKFKPLQDAWTHFWDETFTRGDLLYRFGESISRDGSRTFSDIENKFLKPGECYAQMAERYYDFLYTLLSQEMVCPSKRLITLVGHSITFGIMHELAEIAKDYGHPFNRPITFGSLPDLTWKYFDKLKSTVLAKNPIFGQMAIFDISYLKDEKFISELEVERDVLRALMMQSNVQY